VHNLLQMLSPLESPKRHQDMQSKRHDGSGKWLLQHEQFCIWRDSTKPTASSVRILPCYGIPGAGKTIIRCQKSD